MMKIIPSNDKALHILVDREDYELLNQIPWYVAKTRTRKGIKMTVATGGNKRVYEILGDKYKGKSTIIMSRVIMDAKEDERIRHIRGNGLDNRKRNLKRIAIKRKPNYQKEATKMDEGERLKILCKDCGREIDRTTGLKTGGYCWTCHKPNYMESEKVEAKPAGTVEGTRIIIDGPAEESEYIQTKLGPALTAAFKSVGEAIKTNAMGNAQTAAINMSKAQMPAQKVEPEPKEFKDPMPIINKRLKEYNEMRDELKRQIASVNGKINLLKELQEEMTG